ncbi:GNAT family N-acetyltransferase [Bosea vaviloviae]|uniref:GNAT family N-acetyltransferase n=1 Tax=Bosea vaviloviae TaxID=1526658 RepID=UPI0009F2D950|nr:GNAT family N-acetyltransferase [Bosea vaviloviae]
MPFSRTGQSRGVGTEDRHSLHHHASPTQKWEIPFLLLGRLAVDRQWQGQGYGDALIVHAFKTTRAAAQQIGILGMIVDAKDEKAAGFYEGFGFRRLSGTQNRLVLPLSAMDRLLTD